MEMKIIDKLTAKMFIEKNHYTHTCSTPVISYGFYDDGLLKCAIVYGRPSGKNLASSIWDGGCDDNCLELLRNNQR